MEGRKTGRKTADACVRTACRKAQAVRHTCCAASGVLTGRSPSAMGGTEACLMCSCAGREKWVWDQDVEAPLPACMRTDRSLHRGAQQVIRLGVRRASRSWPCVHAVVMLAGEMRGSLTQRPAPAPPRRPSKRRRCWRLPPGWCRTPGPPPWRRRKWSA